MQKMARDFHLFCCSLRKRFNVDIALASEAAARQLRQLAARAGPAFLEVKSTLKILFTLRLRSGSG